MNHHYNQVARQLVAALCVALLTGCGTTPEPIGTPTPAVTARGPVDSPPPVGETGPAEGWVGDDELTDPAVPADEPVDAHPHDPPTAEQIAAAVTIAKQVVAGWLTADQDRRRQLLEGVAAEALIASFDDPRFTPAAETQQGPTHVVDADQMQIITRHRLNTGDVVDVTLVLDPDATHGWIAVVITK